MNKTTYQFPSTGSIPGIPGEWHAGQLVDVDLDTMTVLGTRLMVAPVPEEVPLVASDEAKTTKTKEAKE